jgi:hypothetical protein
MAEDVINTTEVVKVTQPTAKSFEAPKSFKQGAWMVLVWLSDFFNTKGDAQMHALTMFLASSTLCYTTVRLTHAVCHQIWYNMNLDNQTIMLISANYGILAVMAGVAYFKKDAQGNITIESTKHGDHSDNPPT